MNGKYKIEIIITDDFNENQVIKVNTDSVDDIETNIRLLKKMVTEYDKENYKACYQCGEFHNIDDMSTPEELDIVLICQECLQKLMDGDIKLKDIDDI